MATSSRWRLSTPTDGPAIGGDIPRVPSAQSSPIPRRAAVTKHGEEAGDECHLFAVPTINWGRIRLADVPSDPLAGTLRYH